MILLQIIFEVGQCDMWHMPFWVTWQRLVFEGATFFINLEKKNSTSYVGFLKPGIFFISQCTCGFQQKGET